MSAEQDVLTGVLAEDPSTPKASLHSACAEASQAWKATGKDTKMELESLKLERETLKRAAKVKSKEMKTKRQKISRAKKHTSKVPTDELLQLVAERLCNAHEKVETSQANGGKLASA